jgi:outer membrane protein assembly factor BamC
VNPVFPITPLRVASLTLALSLAGCSSSFMSGDSVDYRTAGTKSAPLDIPPDLTQLAREGRYQPQQGVVSANTMRQAAVAAPAATTTAAAAVAPSAMANMRIDREGNVRWLVAPMAPEALYPLVRAFWLERGFVLDIDEPAIGMMETDWAENRAKIKEDWLRRSMGNLLDSLYSTPQRDRFRTRIERTATGSEVTISHRGMQEVYITEFKDQTRWTPRPADPELEAEFLSRLMVKLGNKEDAARTAVAAASPATPAKARADAPGLRATSLPATASMEIDEGFDRAWRQVGLALDRAGFTIEDRDRGAGLYFVRYIDPKLAGQEEPGFFSKMFRGGKDAVKPQRLRVVVKASGPKTQVSVQTAEGAVDNSEQARTIVGKLIDQLK